MGHPLFDFSHLSVAERVELALALWDSLPDNASDPPLTDGQRLELRRRVETYKRNPSAGSEWTEVRGRVRKRSKKKPNR